MIISPHGCFEQSAHLHFRLQTLLHYLFIRTGSIHDSHFRFLLAIHAPILLKQPFHNISAFLRNYSGLFRFLFLHILEPIIVELFKFLRLLISTHCIDILPANPCGAHLHNLSQFIHSCLLILIA